MREKEYVLWKSLTPKNMPVVFTSLTSLLLLWFMKVFHNRHHFFMAPSSKFSRVSNSNHEKQAPLKAQLIRLLKAIAKELKFESAIIETNWVNRKQGKHEKHVLSSITSVSNCTWQANHVVSLTNIIRKQLDDIPNIPNPAPPQLQNYASISAKTWNTLWI